MLTIRPFRNADPPKMLALWNQCRAGSLAPSYAPLSLNQLQMQVLGVPMFDADSIQIAFDDDIPIGFVHSSFAPTSDGSNLSQTAGHICFLSVLPYYTKTEEAVTGLIRSAEKYLAKFGVREIFGGSPTPSAPFYTGYYGGGEAIAVLHSDEHIVRGYLNAGFNIYQQTVWFQLDLQNYRPVLTTDALQWMTKVSIELNESPRAKSWWEACILANGIWLEATAFLNETGKPIARVRTRISCPDSEESYVLYNGLWSAALMDIRVHPDFRHKGVGSYLLSELVQQLVARRQIISIGAHVAENSMALYSLLSAYQWQQRDTGYIFYKPVR